MNGSSRPEVFCEKSIFKNFSKFTGKDLCHSLFFYKVAGLKPATLLKKRLWYRCFPVNFANLLRIPFFVEHLWWLSLNEINIKCTQKRLFYSKCLIFCCCKSNLKSKSNVITYRSRWIAQGRHHWGGGAEWGSSSPSKMYIINSAFSLSAIVI